MSEKNYDYSYSKLTSLKDEKIPKKIEGNFNCSYNYLTTLEGIPEEIGNDFNCSYNNLTTLEGSPKEIGGNFNCTSNNLVNLKFRPKKINGNFYCRNNNIVENIKQEIIKNQIQAEYYATDDGNYWFEDLKEEFEKYGEYLLKKENQEKEKKEKKEELIKEKQQIQKNKLTINNQDYGLSL